MDTTHSYTVRAKATRVRSGIVSRETAAQPIKFSAPLEFLGESGVWTPEDFFVASVVSCFVSTFSGMADLSKLGFASLEVEAQGTLEKDPGGWKFVEVKLRPHLKINRESDQERARRLLEKAERTCLVARSITARIVLEPSTTVVPEEAAVS
jgi:organic hydroperoxide reductase OsmC/OhrA